MSRQGQCGVYVPSAPSLNQNVPGNEAYIAKLESIHSLMNSKSKGSHSVLTFSNC